MANLVVSIKKLEGLVVTEDYKGDLTGVFRFFSPEYDTGALV